MKKIYVLVVLVFLLCLCGCIKKENEWELTAILGEETSLYKVDGDDIKGTVQFIDNEHIKLSAFIYGKEIFSDIFDYYLYEESESSNIRTIFIFIGNHTIIGMLQDSENGSLLNFNIGEVEYFYFKRNN